MTRANHYKVTLQDMHQHTILLINALINETIDLTCSDFIRISQDLIALDKDQTAREHISNVVKELQFADAFRQKLQHIVIFQQAILDNETISNDDGEEIEIRNVLGSVLRLNYYQMIAAEDDLTRVVHKVQTIMRKFKSFEETTMVFVHLTKITENFKTITTTLSSLADVYVSSADFDFSQLTDYFSDRYSMLSERLTLNWCVSSEYESIEDFRKYYATQDLNGSIELF